MVGFVDLKSDVGLDDAITMVGFDDLKSDVGLDDAITLVGFVDLKSDVGLDDAITMVGFDDFKVLLRDVGLGDPDTMVGFDDLNSDEGMYNAVGIDVTLSAKILWSFVLVGCFPDLSDGIECVGFRDASDSAAGGADESFRDGCAIGISAVGFDGFAVEKDVGFDDAVTGSEVAVGLDTFRSDERDVGLSEPISTVGEAVGFETLLSRTIIEGSEKLDFTIIKPVCFSLFLSASEPSDNSNKLRRVAMIVVAKIIMMLVCVAIKYEELGNGGCGRWRRKLSMTTVWNGWLMNRCDGFGGVGFGDSIPRLIRKWIYSIYSFYNINRFKVYCTF